MNPGTSFLSVCVSAFICCFCLGTVNAQRVVYSVADIPPSEPEFASAYYDYATGDIYISTGDNLVVLVLHGAPFGFIDGQFDPNAVRQDTELGETSTNNRTEISWLSFESPLSTGIFKVGTLLPADVNIRNGEDFDAVYPDATFSFAAPGNGNRAKLNVIFPGFSIPEPNSFLVLAMAGSVMLLRHRRIDQ